MDFLADTSYKQSQAEVIGQLTAAPVATGSQLVGYSGFSTEAFVREPYSADLDFGTGEWSASAWVNIPIALPEANFPVSGNLLPYSYNFDDGSLTGWGTYNSSNAIENGKLKVTFNNWNAYSISPAYSTVANRYYKLGGYIEPVQANGAYIGYGGGYVLVSRTLAQGSGVSYGYWKATGSSANLYVSPSNSAAIGNYAYFDDLFAYEVYNVPIVSRNGPSGSYFELSLNIGGFLVARSFDGTTLRELITTTAYNTGTWLKVDTYYKTDGSLSIAVNGQQVATTGTQTPLLTLNNSNAVLTIGNNFTLNAPFPGSIALLKLSATVPTTEQLQWTYEQEKALFSANALCALPDSNTVADLTFDDKTNRLIAVSSANESYWSGLTRVYTEAVTSGGSLGKVVSTSNVHLVSRSTVNPGVDVTLPAYNIKAHLESDITEATIKQVVVFDFDPVDNSQTAFVLPIGYSAVAVYKAGTELRETISTTKDWSRSFDGFKETITLTTAPGTTNWIQIHAVKE